MSHAALIETDEQLQVLTKGAGHLNRRHKIALIDRVEIAASGTCLLPMSENGCRIAELVRLHLLPQLLNKCDPQSL
jgi:hypothetical protein